MGVRRFQILWLCVSWCLADPLSLVARAERIVFGNRFESRTFAVEDGHVRTLGLTNNVARISLRVESEPFRLWLNKGEVLNGSEFSLVRQSRSVRNGTHRLDLVLSHPKTGIEATISFTAREGDFFMRKQVALACRRPGVLVRDIDVEYFRTSAETDLGGRGQPVYVAGQFFLGLEYPAGYNLASRGEIYLRHHPGHELQKAPWTSKSAVLGAAKRGNVAEAFMRYVEGFRRPPRTYLLYNSWYDLRRNELTVENMAKCYECFRNHLAPYGVTLDAFVPDDGWQDRESIWAANKRILPNGFRPLADILERGGTHLGLWMPLTGVHLDVARGAKQGYEAAPGMHNYCLSGPKFNHKIRDVLRHHILDWHVAYFKHDFNSFTCTASGHGHLPEAIYGFEANVDAELGLLAHERQLRPDIFLNVTSGMWLSPWWLAYADALWMGCGDCGLIKSVPALQRRDWAMTYRDHHLWRRFCKERAQFPMTAVMTHGIIYGKRNMLGGKDEPLDRWANNVVWYFLRGMQMKELYVTPSLLTDVQWDVLGRAARWATDNAPVLRTSRFLGGDPGAGKVYGFASCRGGTAFFGFRNPSLVPQQISARGRDLVGDQPVTLRLLYPFKADAGTLRPQDALTQKLGPNAIRIYRAQADPTIKATKLNPDTFGMPPPAFRVRPKPATHADGKFVLEAEVTPAARAITKATAAILVKNAYDVRLAKAIRLIVNQRPMAAKEIVLEGMRVLVAALPVAGGVFRAEVKIADVTKPFQAKLEVSAWLIADREASPGEPVGPVPDLACPYAARRRTAQALFPEAVVDLSARRVVAVSEEALRSAKAALLHIMIFGSDGARYAGKPILLNGQPVGVVPTSAKPIDRWQRKIVRLPKEKLALLRVENEIRFGNRNGDCYKLRDVALAVQLADGRWAETKLDGKVYCSTKGWLHSEGTLFEKAWSPPICLDFRTK